MKCVDGLVENQTGGQNLYRPFLGGLNLKWFNLHAESPGDARTDKL